LKYTSHCSNISWTTVVLCSDLHWRLFFCPMRYFKSLF